MGAEQTNVPNTYAIGDVLDDKPELTPMAIQSGKLLARRLAGVSEVLTDYVNVCTTVFTPLEYGCCGLSEEDAKSFGWEVDKNDVNHNWGKMIEEVQNHIGGLNWGYKVALREKEVTYLNEYAEFIDEHTLKTVNKKGKERNITADKFIIATGGRPKYPDIPGVENGISSDDLFSLPHSPGKTLLVGASYIALECAGFLAGMGLDTTVMVRSILLRGFDQQMANKIGEYMEEHGHPVWEAVGQEAGWSIRGADRLCECLHHSFHSSGVRLLWS